MIGRRALLASLRLQNFGRCPLRQPCATVYIAVVAVGSGASAGFRSGDETLQPFDVTRLVNVLIV